MTPLILVLSVLVVYLRVVYHELSSSHARFTSLRFLEATFPWLPVPDVRLGASITDVGLP